MRDHSKQKARRSLAIAEEHLEGKKHASVLKKTLGGLLSAFSTDREASKRPFGPSRRSPNLDGLPNF